MFEASLVYRASARGRLQSYTEKPCLVKQNKTKNGTKFCARVTRTPKATRQTTDANAAGLLIVLSYLWKIPVLQADTAASKGSELSCLVLGFKDNT